MKFNQLSVCGLQALLVVALVSQGVVAQSPSSSALSAATSSTTPSPSPSDSPTDSPTSQPTSAEVWLGATNTCQKRDPKQGSPERDLCIQEESGTTCGRKLVVSGASKGKITRYCCDNISDGKKTSCKCGRKNQPVCNDWKSCLSCTALAETRGKSIECKLQVIKTIIERAKSGEYGEGLCGVVHEGAFDRTARQFSVTTCLCNDNAVQTFCQCCGGATLSRDLQSELDLLNAELDKYTLNGIPGEVTHGFFTPGTSTIPDGCHLVPNTDCGDSLTFYSCSTSGNIAHSVVQLETALAAAKADLDAARAQEAGDDSVVESCASDGPQW